MQGMMMNRPLMISDIPKKIARLRCFPGRTPMDLTLGDVGGGCLVVSQFTLHATLKTGNRPGFAEANRPSVGRQECFFHQRVPRRVRRCRDTGLRHTCPV